MNKKSALSLVALLLSAPLTMAASSDLEALKKETEELRNEINKLKVNTVERTRTQGGDNLFFGLDASYDGAKLLINEPSLNKDLALLNQRKHLDEKLGPVSKSGPRVEISGTVGAVAKIHSNTLAADSAKDQHELTASAELDISAQMNDWWTVYSKFAGDSSDGDLGVDLAFITAGNLDESPIYGTAGYFYMPSGSFSSSMLSNPVTKTLGRTKAKGALIGYVAPIGVAAQAFVHNGNVKKGTTKDFDQWGLNVDYNSDFPVLTKDGVHLTAGASYVNNLASSDGISAQTNSYTVKDYIAGYSLRAAASLQDFGLSTEYVAALDRFAATEGASLANTKPKAYNLEGTYNFKTLEKDSYVAVNYGRTKDAKALKLAKRQYGATYSISLFKNTVLGLEHLVKKSYATENKTDHVTTAEIDVYF